MSLRRRTFLGGMATAVGALTTSDLRTRASPERHVHEFGAVGDGVTNDTAALAAAARFIQSMGGGTLVFDPRTYLIGRQSFDGTADGWAHEPAEVIVIRGCPSKVMLVGNGAVLQSAPGLRFGSFDPVTGAVSRPKLPFYDATHVASPFRAAILLEGNRGGVEIRSFEIDGRINETLIGGHWGDAGWQVQHHGINLLDNRGPHKLSDIYAHHLGGDGIVYLSFIPDERAAPVPTEIDNCRCEYNGRQGLTVIGGRGITVSRSRFNHTGQNGVIDSNPHAGVDVEAEGGGLVRDVTFIDCEFASNAGAGFLADTGNSANITLRGCRIVGSANYALWPNKPGMRFYDCIIVGGAVGFYSETNGVGPAPQFHHCRFTDDPRLSPTGRVYNRQVDVAAAVGVLFNDCDFVYGSIALPQTGRTTRFHNCRMSSPVAGISQLNGIFTGENIINGGADLSESQFLGRVIYNGKVITSVTEARAVR